VSIKAGLIEIRAKGSEAFVKEFLMNSEDRITRLLAIIEEKGVGEPNKSKSEKSKSKKQIKKAAKKSKGVIPEPTDWVDKLSSVSGCSPQFISDTFAFKEGSIILVDWEAGNKDANKQREIGIVVVYANEKGLNQEVAPIAAIKASLDKIGITYDSKNLAGILKESPALFSKKKGKWSINLQGRNDSSRLLKDREKAMGYSK